MLEFAKKNNRNNENAQVGGKEIALSKIERYGWKVKDEPGQLMLLNKSLLLVDSTYQRATVSPKVTHIASKWSWLAFGVIIVGRRNGNYWIIDGQHRVEAAKRRSDIKELPCLVFETNDECQEAKGFLDTNTARKPITSLDKFKALVAAKDADALYLNDLIEELGITLTRSSHGARTMNSVAWAITRLKENRQDFELVIRLVTELCENHFLPERVLDGLWYLHRIGKVSLTDARLRDRILKVGIKTLYDATTRASAYYAKGGGKVWADGMLNEINKGLVNKFVMKS